jgi:hypothetical protein
MSERATNLADQLEAVVTEAVSTVESIPDEKWTAFCEPEQCTVAALATHIGNSCAGVMTALVQPIAEGRPTLPITQEQLHAGNAQNARENANRPKPDVLDGIRTHGYAAVSTIRGYSDEELDKTAVLFFSPHPVSAELVIENALVNHLREHLDSINAATA